MNILQFITLDKFSPHPLYVQLSTELEESITKGILKHGDFLPSEKLLCDAFDISPKVVITAYQHLSEKGLVKRFVGKGTQVNTRLTTRINMNQVLGVESNYPITVKNVYKDIILNDNKTPVEGHELSLVHQIGSAQNNPVFFRKIYLDKTVFPDDIDFENIIIYARDVLKLEHLRMQSKMMVVNLPALEAAYLDVNPESPGFYLRTVLKQKEKPIAFIKTYFSGEYTVWSDDPEIIQL